MSLTNSEIAGVCWDALRQDEIDAGRPTPAPWSQLPDWDREDVIDRVELYRQGASAEECYTAQRDAVLDAGFEVDALMSPPWEQLPADLRERGERFHALVQEHAA